MKFYLRIIDKTACEETGEYGDAHALYVKMSTLGIFGSAEIDRMIGTAVRQGGVTYTGNGMFVAIRFDADGK